ncbi:MULTISPECIES: hypothetical protein [unclassified Streptomyces]|uniref:hypothetical protein n=1 Tax=unclassified Streptomyces TaxID=2593676 RepID=UPI00365FB34C
MATTTKAQAPQPSGKKRRTKGARDKNAPKRPLSAYLIFATEQRPRLVKANPSASIADLAIRLGEMWKALSDTQQAPYRAQAAEDQRRYSAEREAYEAKQAAASK